MKVQFELMSIGWTTEIRQAVLLPTSRSFPFSPVPGDELVLDVVSAHYYEKHSSTSTTTAGRSVALITINSSDRWSKGERDSALASRCNKACMHKTTVQMAIFPIAPIYDSF